MASLFFRLILRAGVVRFLFIPSRQVKACMGTCMCQELSQAPQSIIREAEDGISQRRNVVLIGLHMAHTELRHLELEFFLAKKEKRHGLMFSLRLNMGSDSTSRRWWGGHIVEID